MVGHEEAAKWYATTVLFLNKAIYDVPARWTIPLRKVQITRKVKGEDERAKEMKRESERKERR